MERIWYAVQETSADDWETGSYNIEEAVEMLKKQGHGLIAAIDEDNEFCLDEYTYEDVVGE